MEYMSEMKERKKERRDILFIVPFDQSNMCTVAIQSPQSRNDKLFFSCCPSRAVEEEQEENLLLLFLPETTVCPH